MVLGSRLSDLVLLSAVAASAGCSSDGTGPSDPGRIEVVIATTGNDPDPDGYTVALDGGTPAGAALSSTTVFDGIAAGTHDIVIGDVAEQCTVSNGNLHSLNVQSGATTRLNLTVTCGGEGDLPGRIEVVIATTGIDPDPDGYTLALDGGTPAPAPVASTTIFEGIAPGTHQIAIGKVAQHCTVSNGPLQSFDVQPGATTRLDVTVACLVRTRPAGVVATTAVLPYRPYGVAVARDGRVYAALIGGSDVTQATLETRVFGGNVSVGFQPPHVAVNPAGTRVYATLQGGRALAVVDAETNRRIVTIPFASDGFNLAVAPDGAHVYATTAAGDLHTIDAVTNTIIRSIDVGDAANGLAFSPDEATLYVTSRDAGTVTAVNTATGAATRTYVVGGMPQRIAVSNDGSTLYVANELSGLDVIDVATGAVTYVSMGVPGYGLGLTPDGTQLYVALPSSGVVRVVDATTLATVGDITVGGAPRNVAFSRTGDVALVTTEAAVVFIE